MERGVEMSASNEWFDDHLTPNGWIEGSRKADLGEVYSKPEPENRVLTLRFNEYMSNPFSRKDTWYTEIWRDIQIVT